MPSKLSSCASVFKVFREHQGEERIELQDRLHDKLPDKLSDSAVKVLEALKENPHLTALELAAKTGIKERMIRNHIVALKVAVLIERIDSNKTGYRKLNL